MTTLAKEVTLVDDAQLPCAVLTQAGVSLHVVLHQLSGFARTHPASSCFPYLGEPMGGGAGEAAMAPAIATTAAVSRGAAAAAALAAAAVAAAAAPGPAGVRIMLVDGSRARRLLGLASVLAQTRAHGRPLHIYDAPQGAVAAGCAPQRRRHPPPVIAL